MSPLPRTFRNPAYLQNSLTMLLFFASWGIWWSFFQIWLTNQDRGLGLNGAEVGTIYAVNSLVTLLIMFVYGTVQDRLGARRSLAVLVAGITTLVGPFMIWVYEPLLRGQFMIGVFLGALVLSAGFMAGVGLLEALAERFSRRSGYEYGQARMWGSFGYALVALAAGFLFTVNPHLNFWVGSAFGLACLVNQLAWRSPAAPADRVIEKAATRPGTREMLGLLRMPSLWQVIVFVLFSWTFYTVFDQQMFPAFYTGLFPTQEQGQQVYGVLNSVQVFTEAVMLGLVPILMRKVGVRTALLMGVSVMFLRILGCALLTDPVAVSAVKMLHAIEVPLFILPIFRYFTLHFSTALSATLYMVGFQISAQIGNVLMSAPLGALRDSIGYQPTFLVIAGIVALSGVYAAAVLKRDDRDVLGDPFVRDRAAGDPPADSNTPDSSATVASRQEALA